MPLVTRTSAQGNIFAQDLQPTGWKDGDVWIDTSINPHRLFVNVSGTASLTVAIGV